MRVPHQLDGNDDQRLTTTPRVGSVREKIGVFERAAGVRQDTHPQLPQLGASCRREVREGAPHEVRALIPGMAASLPLAMCSGTS